MNEVRTRFAPSPTGYLHVGGIRTALFAWLVARKAGGKFILRIEDTDQARKVEGSVEHIQECLRWLGLDPDEGPFFQSQRLKTYHNWAKKLLEAGRAYADPFTPAEVQTFRELASGSSQPFLFRNFRPKDPVDWKPGVPLRFKSEPKDYTWHDEVMGDLHAGQEAVDDFILIKSDGYPTYNFAHIIDDYEMKISHIIRGQEFIASTPNYLNLYEALEIERPIFATVPHIMAQSGNKKLSKRDGAKDALGYRGEGYLPEAFISFLATLGWNDGTTQEIFSRDELIQKFDLARVQKSGARFDEQRLDWINGSFLRVLSADKLFEAAEQFWPEEAKKFNDDYKKQVLGLVQERLKFLGELTELTRFFFEELSFDETLVLSNNQLKKFDPDELVVLLEVAKVRLDGSDFSKADLTEKLNALLEETEQKPAVLFSLIRIATTNAPASPELAGTLAVLGKQTSLERIEKALKDLSVMLS